MGSTGSSLRVQSPQKGAIMDELEERCKYSWWEWTSARLRDLCHVPAGGDHPGRGQWEWEQQKGSHKRL